MMTIFMVDPPLRKAGSPLENSQAGTNASDENLTLLRISLGETSNPFVALRRHPPEVIA
jgi:hypothetical protein